MRNNTIDLVLEKDSGLIKPDYTLISDERSLIGAECPKTRSEVVDCLADLLQHSPLREVLITSEKVADHGFESHEALKREELEGIAADLRSRVAGLRIVVEK